MPGLGPPEGGPPLPGGKGGGGEGSNAGSKDGSKAGSKDGSKGEAGGEEEEKKPPPPVYVQGNRSFSSPRQVAADGAPVKDECIIM